MQDLKLSIIQASLSWEDRNKNLDYFNNKIASIHPGTDLILLPEMFNSGFSMDVEKCSEKIDGPTIMWMQEKAITANCVIAGSLLIQEDGKYFNRFVWMKPDGTCEHYDKRHLFSMAGEDKIISAGKSLTIVEINGWKLNLQVCYDLRFPVWSKNEFTANEHAFDVLVYIANWPEKRKQAYQRLLPARAIENQSYVVWANRMGMDGKGIDHSGNSAAYDPQGNIIIEGSPGEECILNVRLSYQLLSEQRSNFRIGPDWDRFKILNG